MRQAMTNPASVVLFGNPPRAARRATKRKSTKRASPTVVIVKGNPVAKKKSSKRGKRSPKARRSKAQKRATARMLAANRRSRSGKSSGKVKRRKSRRRAKASSKGRKSRRRARHVATSAGAVVVVHKVKKGRVSKVHARRLRGRVYRRVKVNPAGGASLGFLAGLTGVIDNAKASARQGIKGYALMGAGAAGAVFGGALMQRATQPIIEKFAPALASNPLTARVLAAVNFYATGWAVQKWIVPSKHRDVKRGILAGAAVAAIIELIKPGLVREQLARLPLVGGVFGQTLAGLESDLGAYVENTVNGLSRETDSDILGVSGYEMPGVNGYEGNTLSCDNVDSGDELVSSGVADDGSGSY